MRLLLEDGVKYIPYEYENEDELEQMVVEHSEIMFGSDSVLLPKQRIRMLSGKGTVPDGFLLYTGSKEWSVVEIELASHPLYDHIVGQIHKFNSALRNPSERKKLVNVFFDHIRSDHILRHKFESAVVGTELHKFLSDVLDREPQIVIVIDKEDADLKEVCESFTSKPTVAVFETYVRHGVGLEVHIHSVDSLSEREPEPVGKEGEPTKIAKRLEFWQQLLARSRSRTPLFANISPGKNHWISKGAGRSGLSYDYTILNHWGDVELYIDRGKDAHTNKRIFDTLYAKKDEIESAFAGSLSWERLDGKRACRVGWTCNEGGLLDESKWDLIQDKLVDAMVRLEGAFRDHIKDLDI